VEEKQIPQPRLERKKRREMKKSTQTRIDQVRYSQLARMKKRRVMLKNS
jgi:hypothetical protein